MPRAKSPGAGTGPDPVTAAVVSAVNSLTGNVGKGAKSAAAAAGRPAK
jgi:hypothetical protein